MGRNDGILNCFRERYDDDRIMLMKRRSKRRIEFLMQVDERPLAPSVTAPS
jgi:hypothetical protein